MIESVIINNFKSIKKLELERLGKLNVFIGPNNSGKSSILQSIAFLAQSLRTSIQYHGKFVDVGSFNEVIFTGKTRKKIVIELGFSLAEEMKDYHWREKLRTSAPLSTKFEVTIGPKGIEKQILECPTCEMTCNFCQEEANGTRTTLKLNGEEVSQAGHSLEVLLGWALRRPSKRSLRELYSSKLDDVLFINGLLQGINSRLRNTYYFSTTRAIKQWNQTLKEVHFFGATGKDAISMLHHVYSNEPPIFDKISRWVKKLGVGRLISGTKGAEASISIEDPMLKKRVNIVNSGFGVNQLLSVIGQCFASPQRSTIMIEEPEIHLHPGAIGTLVDMFLETTSENKQILITTHSDRLIFELWARLKLGLVKSDDVRLYLVDKKPKGTFVKLIKPDKQIKKIRRELAILYKPKSPLDELLKIAGKSGEKRLSEKDLSQI